MGSCTIYRELDGKLTRGEVEKQFREMQDTARCEHGDSYSGDWNMCRGLIFANLPGPGFASTDEQAEKWLLDHCQKWGDAIAVRFTKRTVEKAAGFTIPAGYDMYDPCSLRAGGKAYCHAYHRNYRGQDITILADALSAEDKGLLWKALTKYADAQKADKKLSDEYWAAMQFLKSDKPAPAGFFERLPKLREEKIASKNAFEQAERELKALDEKLGEPLLKYRQEQKWMIGGCCSS